MHVSQFSDFGKFIACSKLFREIYNITFKLPCDAICKVQCKKISKQIKFKMFQTIRFKTLYAVSTLNKYSSIKKDNCLEKNKVTC